MEKNYGAYIMCFFVWIYYIVTRRSKVFVRQCITVRIGEISKYYQLFNTDNQKN